MGNTTPVNSHQEVLDSCFAGACRGLKKEPLLCWHMLTWFTGLQALHSLRSIHVPSFMGNPHAFQSCRVWYCMRRHYEVFILLSHWLPLARHITPCNSPVSGSTGWTECSWRGEVPKRSRKNLLSKSFQQTNVDVENLDYWPGETSDFHWLRIGMYENVCSVDLNL